ncbi:MAG: tRNA lysidine(34) synthetase TilS [Candidatus Rokubacteria bacterium GWC2_70_16]|nr:MAG: tRNA lysidine(34) synthetase TilS [Candidatus Rokubacteria bacterium GWC2_70_16]
MPQPVTAPCSLAEGVLATIRRHALLAGGETVLVAVSGGADSVALLHLLRLLAGPLRLSLHAFHVHHGLRAEADDDARFVLDLCGRWDVPAQLERVRVAAPEERGAGREGLEAAARRARYAAFAARAAALGASRVATGHTADDQAETVCMRLLEGAGPRGLAGIPATRGPYIRPLLETSRRAIEAHLRAHGIPWVEDRSNRDPRFLRNRVRHEVLPYLAEAYDADVIRALCRGAAVARDVVSRLDARAAAELGRLAEVRDSGLLLPAAALAALPGEVAVEVLRGALLRLGVATPLRAHAHRALHQLLDPAAPGRQVRLGAMALERSGGWLRIGPASGASVVARSWRLPGALALPEVGLSIEARCLARPAGWLPPPGPRMVAFDADRVPADLTVRGRRPGDRFAPFGGPGQRRLKAFLAEAGIPRWERDRIPLLEAGGEILWVAGLRRGRAAPVTPDTRRILEVTLSVALAMPTSQE